MGVEGKSTWPLKGWEPLAHHLKLSLSIKCKAPPPQKNSNFFFRAYDWMMSRTKSYPFQRKSSSSSSGVNFTNTLHVAFLHLHYFRFELFWHKNIGANALIKMLVKRCVNFINIRLWDLRWTQWRRAYSVKVGRNF